MLTPNTRTQQGKEQVAARIPVMNEPQFRRAKKLIHSLCANYDHGNCVLLDNRFGTCVCPQLISYSLLCKYFRMAVLPADKELHAEIMEKDPRRLCGDCSRPFIAARPNALYCKSCSSRRTRLNQREWVRKKRAKCRKSSG